MKPPLRRCALYTRKSSEEGLDQQFNSLDAQREACAAFVKSQSGEGWKALPEIYDDGGISGGTMLRPALQRLLADIAAGRVDVVVVYKIDRLTRSLADFARMVEIFDRHEVSFVSVTQAFNTTSSMGRLTLNVLLSFAQFEREVTGERIRDKIAASKKKGMWMGGVLPIGYDLPEKGTRALLVNSTEAETVRRIFALYLKLGSVHALAERLAAEGTLSKRRTTRAGKVVGGLRISRGALFHLLRNRIYLGEIHHRGTLHPGLHAPIIDEAIFTAVQASLDANTRRRGSVPGRVSRSPLVGRIFDSDNEPMSPTFAYGKNGKLYRYYVSAPLQQGARRAKDDGSPRRVSVASLETRITSVLVRLLGDQVTEPLSLLIRVEVHENGLELILPLQYLARVRSCLGTGETAAPDHFDPSRLRLSLKARVGTQRSRSAIIGGTPDGLRRDAALIAALRKAHVMIGGAGRDVPVLAKAPESSYQRRLVRLAFLAPDLQRAILAGRQPFGLKLASLLSADVPLSWSKQRRLFEKLATLHQAELD